MAAGLTVERGRLADLRSFLEEAVGADVANALQRDNLRIDGALSARGATLELVELLERAGPYGAGHPQPIFAFPAHAIRNPRVVGQNHVSVSLSAGDGASLKAIAFRAADRELGQLLLAPPPRLHVAGTLSADFWQGSRRVQLRITDAAVPQG
jgi:single-stranded-DNA-specific exonuclease